MLFFNAIQQTLLNVQGYCQVITVQFHIPAVGIGLAAFVQRSVYFQDIQITFILINPLHMPGAIFLEAAAELGLSVKIPLVLDITDQTVYLVSQMRFYAIIFFHFLNNLKVNTVSVIL